MKCLNCGNELSNDAMFCDNCGTVVARQSGGGDVMFCGICGASLASGAEFCGECGARVGEAKQESVNYMFCGNCGKKNPETAQVCGGCGQKLHKDYSEEEPSGKKYGVIIAVLVSVIIILAAAAGGYLFYINSNDVKPVPTATPVVSEKPYIGEEEKEEDSEVPAGKYDTYYVVNCKTSIYLREAPSTDANVLHEIPLGSAVSYVEDAKNGFAKIIYNGQTGYSLQVYLSDNYDDVRKNNTNPPPPPANTSSATKAPSSSSSSSSASSSVISNPTYRTYGDADYNFNCAYPSHFKVYNDSDKFVRYSLKAPDNTATLKICATGNGSGLTVQKVSDNFVSSYPGTVDYKDSGSDWCAISTIKNGQTHYGYFKVESDKIRGFELHYNSTYTSVYDQYVNDIYNSLQLN